MTVVEAWSAVMADVQSISKSDRNEDQHFNFRGIDATMNAVGPALRAHGVVVLPQVEEYTCEEYETRKGTRMKSTTVRVRWRIFGPEGDSFEAVTYGEAADSGDKGTAKAQAVAMRVLLLQALCVPTGDPDPDSTSHDRAAPASPQAPPDPRAPLFAAVREARTQQGMSVDEARADFAALFEGATLDDADESLLRGYLEHLAEQKGKLHRSKPERTPVGELRAKIKALAVEKGVDPDEELSAWSGKASLVDKTDKVALKGFWHALSGEPVFEGDEEWQTAKEETTA